MKPGIRLVAIKYRTCQYLRCVQAATDTLWVMGRAEGDYCPQHGNQKYQEAQVYLRAEALLGDAREGGQDVE